jgi:hypothetical protein
MREPAIRRVEELLEGELGDSKDGTATATPKSICKPAKTNFLLVILFSIGDLKKGNVLHE